MCTAISCRWQDHYFGRNLDIEVSYREQVVITPRGRHYALRSGTQFRTQTALIGMASVVGDTALYYEAANEKGLCAAGLNFPGVAVYHEPREGMDNITPFELIPWILGQCGSVREARVLLERLNLTNIPFSPQMPLAPLHFMFSDGRESLVAEPREDGLKLYDNPYHVMTNNPPFEYHLWNLRNYRHLCPANRENRFSPAYELGDYAVGMGAVGLPGDVSSASRFVRTAFHLANSRGGETELDRVTEFFHILDTVAMVRGAAITNDGKEDITLYTCCIDAAHGIYYYKTYGNSQLTAIRMDQVDLDGDQLYCYDLNRSQQICWGN